MVYWCAWLLVSWTLQGAINSGRWFSGEALQPAARWTLQSMWIGMGLIWPAWRLTRFGSNGAAVQTFADLLSMFMIAQVVIWPLSTLGEWSVEQALGINGVLLAWGLWVGWVVRLGRGAERSKLGAAAAMACITATQVAGPLLAAATGWSAASNYCPYVMMWQLGDPLQSYDVTAIGYRLAWVAAAAAAAWTMTPFVLPDRAADGSSGYHG